MNLEDVLLIIFILANTFGAAALTRLPLPKAWARIGPFVRFAAIVVLLFVIASVDESTSRLVFHDLPRGTIFIRAFLVGGISTVIYLFMPQRTPGNGQVVEEQNAKLDRLLTETIDRHTYETKHVALEKLVEEGKAEREALGKRITELEGQVAARQKRGRGGAA